MRGLSIWFEAHDGNRADRESFQQTRALIWVADSALYSAEQLLARLPLPWVTRVAQTVAAVKALCEAPGEHYACQVAEEGYCWAVLCYEPKGWRQRWCRVQSEAARSREGKTLERRLRIREQALTKAVAALQHQEFARGRSRTGAGGYRGAEAQTIYAGT